MQKFPKSSILRLGLLLGAATLALVVYQVFRPRSIDEKIIRAVFSFASGNTSQVVNTLPDQTIASQKERRVDSGCLERKIYAKALQSPVDIRVLKVEFFNEGSTAAVHFQLRSKSCTLVRIVVGKEGDNGPVIGIESWMYLISGMYMAANEDISRYEPSPKIGFYKFNQKFAIDYEVCGYSKYSSGENSESFQDGARRELEAALKNADQKGNNVSPKSNLRVERRQEGSPKSGSSL